MCNLGVQCVKWGCSHTEHLVRWVDGDVDAGTPSDYLPFQDNSASHCLTNVLLRSCGTRPGECSACATVEPGANLLILPVPVDGATLWDHGRIILPACVGVRFGVFGVTTAFTLPPSVPTYVGPNIGGQWRHTMRGGHTRFAPSSLCQIQALRGAHL